MRRPRFQFRLSTLLWTTLAVACWFGGMRAVNDALRIDFSGTPVPIRFEKPNR
ncbi:MAG TPA: hypothetical protein VND64_27875 [Pirellulales bacterium]|nr:hypothetical protein [Pirellulales bacterium]